MQFTEKRRSRPGHLPANGRGAFPGGPSSRGGSLLTDREQRRVRVVALALVVATYVVALVAMIVVDPPQAWWGAAIFLAIGAIAPLHALFMWLLMRRRLWPATEAMGWANGAVARAWMTIDGGEPPANTEVALSRLDGRTDDDAVAMRLSCFATSSRVEELRTGLAEWQPSGPVGQARLALYTSDLAWLDGGVDDLRTAWSAASAIPDPDHQIEEQVRVLIEDARRLADARQDPFPRLVDAHRVLGSRATEFEAHLDLPARQRGTRRLVLLSLLPALLVGLLGIMAWSRTLG